MFNRAYRMETIYIIDNRQGGFQVEDTLLTELGRLVEELRGKENATVYAVPDAVLDAVKKEKHLDKFLHEVFLQVSGSGGVDIANVIRREFGISKEHTDHMDRWAPHIKEQLEDVLHDAIDRAEIRTGKLFFTGSVPKAQMGEALGLLQSMAHAAVSRQLNPKCAGPDAYVEMLNLTLRYYGLPYTYPAGDDISYRNLIASERLEAMAGNNPSITAALKAAAKIWYQQSGFTFLESRESYHTFDQVRQLLYALTPEQLGRLRSDFIHYIREEAIRLSKKPELHRAEYLKAMLEATLSWSLEAQGG
jgi:hypothetical protein